jgi:[acyl-carrier-protein] S-malonyltransferase
MRAIKLHQIFDRWHLELSVAHEKKLLMSAETAYIFPGQASQYVGMGKDLAQHYAAAREIFDAASEALSFSISRLCFDGTDEELALTENTQPAILTVSVAALCAMKSEHLAPPDLVAGHSLGEYSALVAAGALSFKDAVRIVRLRGRYMQEAVPVGAGAMAAIVGAELSDIVAACGDAKEGEVCAPANINSPTQIVIAGHAGAVERAMALLRERGVRRAIKLNVSAPFHCALMEQAQERLADDLAQVEFKDLQMPLVTNVDAAKITRGAEARDALIRQVSSPVRWRESIELMVQDGVKRFIEVGPGKVLSGLVRQIARDAQCLNVEDFGTLNLAREALRAGA